MSCVDMRCLARIHFVGSHRLDEVVMVPNSWVSLGIQIVLRDLEPKEDSHEIATVVTMKRYSPSFCPNPFNSFVSVACKCFVGLTSLPPPRDGSLHVSCVEPSSGKTEAVSIAAAAS